MTTLLHKNYFKLTIALYAICLFIDRLYFIQIEIGLMNSFEHLYVLRKFCKHFLARDMKIQFSSIFQTFFTDGRCVYTLLIRRNVENQVYQHSEILKQNLKYHIIHIYNSKPHRPIQSIQFHIPFVLSLHLIQFLRQKMQLHLTL